MTEPFNRVLTNQSERPVSDDQNQNASNAQQSYMLLADYMLRASASVATGESVPLNNDSTFGFLADSFQVLAQSPSPSLNLTITQGVGFNYLATPGAVNIGGISGCDDTYPLHPIFLSAGQVVSVPTPNSSNPRYDIIEVAYDVQQNSPLSVDILNPSAGTVTPTSKNKVLTYDLSGDVGYVAASSASTTAIGYKSGVAGSSPVVPTVTSGYVIIAVIFVPASAANIPQKQIVDARPLAFPGSQARVNGTFTLVTDGTNVTGLSGKIQAPPGVEAAAFVHANLNANELTIIIIAGGGEGAECQYRLSGPGLSTASVLATNSTVFWAEVLAASASSSVNLQLGNSDQNAWPAPFAGVFSNLIAYSTSNMTGPHVLTVKKNGALQTPTVTLPTGSSGPIQDMTHSFSFAAGDLITIIDTGGSGATAQATDMVANAQISTTGTGGSSIVTGVINGVAPLSNLSVADANDLGTIGIAPVGVPGPVAAYGIASADAQQVFRIRLPIFSQAGTFTFTVDALISSGQDNS